MSLLVALTLKASGATGEKLLFLHSKVIPDYESSDDVFALVSHRECTKLAGSVVYETCLAGRSEVIAKMFDRCIGSGEIRYKDKKADKVLKLSLPSAHSVEESVADTEGRNDHVDKLYRPNKKPWFPEFMLDSGLLDALCAYAINDKVKPIYPAGLYDKGWLYGKIRDSIFAIREERQPFIGFHGVVTTAVAGRGCREIIGFEQSDSRGENDSCRLLDRDTKAVIAESDIDPATGLFSLSAADPVRNGMLVFETVCPVASVDFGLILGFDIRVDAASCCIKDMYGNEKMIGKRKSRPKVFEETTWYEAASVGSSDAYSKLSEIFVRVLATLGPDVVIADPYFMGTIRQDDRGNLMLEPTQRAFINALVIVAVDYGLDSVTVVGNSRMNNHGEEATDDKSKMDVLKAKYECLWRNFFDGKLFEHIKPWKMVFRRAQTDFHNRYWFEGDGNGYINGSRAVIVSNSLSGMIEADFCGIDSQEHYNTVTSRYDNIIRKSDLFAEI